jgi:hypothetical protein
MVPAEHKSLLIQSGIDFMRVITEAYGQDEGIQLWNTIADTLDPSLKGDIFFALITGEFINTVKIIKYTGGNFVQLIKAIRTVSDYSLKDAKDIADEVIAGRTGTIIVEPRLRSHAISTLQAINCTLSN